MLEKENLGGEHGCCDVTVLPVKTPFTLQR